MKRKADTEGSPGSSTSSPGRASKKLNVELSTDDPTVPAITSAPQSDKNELFLMLDNHILKKALTELHTHLMGMGSADFWVSKIMENYLPRIELHEQENKTGRVKQHGKVLFPLKDILVATGGSGGRVDDELDESLFEALFFEGFDKHNLTVALEKDKEGESLSVISNQTIVNMLNDEDSRLHRKGPLRALIRNWFEFLGTDGQHVTHSEVLQTYRGQFTPGFCPQRFVMKDPIVNTRPDVLGILLNSTCARYAKAGVNYIEYSVSCGDLLNDGKFDAIRKNTFREDLFSAITKSTAASETPKQPGSGTRPPASAKPTKDKSDLVPVLPDVLLMEKVEPSWRKFVDYKEKPKDQVFAFLAAFSRDKHLKLAESGEILAGTVLCTLRDGQWGEMDPRPLSIRNAYHALSEAAQCAMEEAVAAERIALATGAVTTAVAMAAAQPNPKPSMMHHAYFALGQRAKEAAVEAGASERHELAKALKLMEAAVTAGAQAAAQVDARPLNNRDVYSLLGAIASEGDEIDHFLRNAQCEEEKAQFMEALQEAQATAEASKEAAKSAAAAKTVAVAALNVHKQKKQIASVVQAREMAATVVETTSRAETLAIKVAERDVETVACLRLRALAKVLCTDPHLEKVYPTIVAAETGEGKPSLVEQLRKKLQHATQPFADGDDAKRKEVIKSEPYVNAVVGLDWVGDELGHPFCIFSHDKFVTLVAEWMGTNDHFGVRIHAGEGPIRPSTRKKTDSKLRLAFYLHMYILTEGIMLYHRKLCKELEKNPKTAVLKPRIRIGHGVAFLWGCEKKDKDGGKIAELTQFDRDMDVFRCFLRDNDIVCELNPTSNHMLLPSTFHSGDLQNERTLQCFLREELPVVLATDDDGIWAIHKCKRHYHHVSVAAEYCQAIECGDITSTVQLQKMLNWGRSSAFAGESLKAKAKSEGKKAPTITAAEDTTRSSSSRDDLAPDVQDAIANEDEEAEP